MMDIIADIIGTLGVGLTLLAYILLQLDRIESETRLYSLLNLLGASLVLFSLFYNWNTPAFVMEVAWVGISLYGFIRHFNAIPKKR